MKEHPILFSALMVREILEGRKTQTRRVVNPQPVGEKCGDSAYYEWAEALAESCNQYPTADAVHEKSNSIRSHKRIFPFRNPEGRLFSPSCLYGRPGDRLWVRETLEVVSNWGTIHYAADNAPCYDPDYVKAGFPYCSEADAIVERYGDSYYANEAKLVPSIFMPRWASRITLEITDVRVQRLQDITDIDAYAEGCNDDGHPYLSPFGGRAVVNNFAHLWDSINAKREGGRKTHDKEHLKARKPYSWDANPWVWALRFKTVKP